MDLVGLPPEQGEVWLVELDPTVGSEIQKTRPCAVVSPAEMNRYLRTVIVAPLTTADRPYPVRIPVLFRRKRGQVALDQIRTVDKMRLMKKLGILDPATLRESLSVLTEMFAPND
ncbi:MAG TPA: type II toxin-antitoxin system PemK/MazF family toxin [Bryobacteraceae bacterium]|nr:type II toxin-antitoxin system PemK/MazF family toxin [Bryobacteraceae bacterium]